MHNFLPNHPYLDHLPCKNFWDFFFIIQQQTNVHGGQIVCIQSFPFFTWLCRVLMKSSITTCEWNSFMCTIHWINSIFGCWSCGINIRRGDAWEGLFAQTERRRSEWNLMMAFTVVLEICVIVTELELPITGSQITSLIMTVNFKPVTVSISF